MFCLLLHLFALLLLSSPASPGSGFSTPPTSSRSPPASPERISRNPPLTGPPGRCATRVGRPGPATPSFRRPALAPPPPGHYEDIAFELGVTAHRPVIGDGALASTAWHPAFEDLNDDGFVDLYVSKGNVEAQEGYATRGSERAVPRPAGRDVQQRDRGVRDGRHGTGPGGRGRRPGPRWPARPRVGRPPRAGPGVAQRGARGRRPGRGTGSASTSSSPARTATPSARGWPCGSTTGCCERERTVGGGHASGTLGPIHVGLGPATARRGPRDLAGRDGRPVAARRGRPIRDHPTRRCMRWRRGCRDRPAGRGSTCPTSGGRRRRRRSRPARYSSGSSGLRARMAERGYDRVVVYADREHSANLPG